MKSRKDIENLIKNISFCLLIAMTACKVTGEDLDTWKGTVKGPGKIVAVLLTEKYEVSLRTRAALALVDMDRQDVDGIAELQRAIQSLEEESRNQIITRMLPELEKMMKDPTGSQASDLESGPSPRQVRAKDAAFLLITFADQKTRANLTRAIINWYVDDFNGRNLAGNYSAEQIVRALGAPAATVLVEALSTKLPQQALIKIAELISQLGSASAKAKAGEKVIQIQSEMEGPDYLKWLESEITKQMKESGKKPDPEVIKKAAELNRNNFIVDGVLVAMKFLADQRNVADRLIQIASLQSKDPKIVERRVRALQALEGNAKKQHLQQLLKLALDSENPVSVRDYSFDRVGDIGSPEAIPAMWPLVEDAENQRLRWRAGELVLAIGGNSVLSKFFSTLPSGKPGRRSKTKKPSKEVAYLPEELEGYATRLSQMNPLPVSLAKAQLSSPFWWNRVIAIMYFERRGTKKDIALLKELTSDNAKVKGKGWKKDETVGKVAKRALASLQERLK